MELTQIQILDKFYKKLRDNLLRKERKIVNNSVLWTLLNLNDKNRKEIIDNSTISSIAFEKIDLTNLTDTGLIKIYNQRVNSIEYGLTSLGIWFIEKQTLGFGDDYLLKLIDSKYFFFKATRKPLNTQDKIALLSLICIRNFSKDTMMDLNSDKDCKYWEKIFTDVYKFLIAGKYVDETKTNQDFLEKKGSELPVQYLMRHRNDLPIKSENIFKNPGGKTYWLEISRSGKVDDSSLVYLFKLLFGKIKEHVEIEEIIDFCNTVRQKYAHFVVNNFELFNSSVDQSIENSIEEYFING
jgi:hypothetical protein